MNINKITIGIPNEMCARTGISGRFINASEIGVFPSQLVKPMGESTPSIYSSNTEASIFHVRPQVLLFHQFVRQLINESSGIFLQLQLEIADQKKRWYTDIVRYSKLYRSLIRACIENIKENMDYCDPEDRMTFQNLISIFYSVECIWHLCEIFYMDTAIDQYVRGNLLEWVRFHIPKYEFRAARLIADKLGVGIESYSDYWDTVIGCILQGRISEACILLDKHSNGRSKAFIAAKDMLKAMPVFDNRQMDVVAQFNLSRKHWMITSQGKLEAGVWASDPKLTLIMRLVIGEELAWTEVQPQCQEWYELLAAWIFYTHPVAKLCELGRFAKLCIARMKVEMKHIDHILLSVISYKYELIKDLQTLGENGWLVTHLVDLLYHAKYEEGIFKHRGNVLQLRETFLFEYGTLLMGHHSLWQVGIGYLDYCPTYGSAAIQLLLPRIANTEQRTILAMREASKRGLWRLEHSMAKIRGLHHLQYKSYGNALVWSVKSGNCNCITYIVHKVLKHYLANCKLLYKDLLLDLGYCYMANDSLVFLSKYYHFHEECRKKQYSKANNSIVALLASKYTPQFFWEALFMDLLNLLEHTDVTFTYKNAMIISREFEDHIRFVPSEEKARTIRIILARNLGIIFSKNATLSNKPKAIAKNVK